MSRSCLAFGPFWILVFATALAPRLTAQEAVPNVPEFKTLKEVAAYFIERGEIAGCIFHVVDRKGIVQTEVAGLATLQPRRPMTDDAIFWIASMSKPVTAACVLMLVDEGKLSLDDPIDRHLPEMANLALSDGSKPKITIRQLLTHTSGMRELPRTEAYRSKTLAEASDKYARLPLDFPPGSRWQYSQTSINTAARIVEVVSGQSFDQFVDGRLCQPLDMKDTAFYLNDSQMPRLASTYRKTESGLEPDTILVLDGKLPTDRNRFPAANGGLFSTARDYGRFCHMLLNLGKWNGNSVLSEASVRAMGTIATGELKTGFTTGNGWGIGCCVVREPQGVTASLSQGSFGHGGAHGTQAWIDPTRGKAYILMVQRANFPNSDNSDLRAAFQKTAAR
jgi:CubicO group peptidase (beta-lactamase class C family)